MRSETLSNPVASEGDSNDITSWLLDSAERDTELSHINAIEDDLLQELLSEGK